MAEREIPVFTVLKNNRILKNIYLLDNPPVSSSPVAEKGSENEETLLVGRHPDCHIKLEHPSISRFHLRIHSNPASRSLYITDLSSVHGTWISGMKVEPDARTKLNEGDTLQLGGSSRLYRLHWVPYSRAYDTENPFIPQMGTDAAEEENEEEPICQDENYLSSQNEQLHTVSEENVCLSVQKLSPPTPLRSKDLYDSFSDEEASENGSSPYDMYKNKENEISSIKSCHFEEEDIKPQALSPVSGFQTESQIESLVNLEMESENISNLSIWSRRGKCKSVKIETSQSGAESVRTDSDVITMVHETQITELNPENRCASPDHVFTPDKEDLCPVTLYRGSSKKKSGVALKSGSVLNISVSSFDFDDDIEVFTPDKENMTPNTRMLRLMGNVDDDVKHEKSYKSSSLKKSCNSNMLEDGFLVSPLTRNENQYGSAAFDDDDDDEVFTPDKENVTPNTRLLRLMGKLDEGKHEKSYKPSPLKKSVNMHEDGFLVLPLSPNGNVLQERRSTNSATKIRYVSLQKEMNATKKNADREPFRPLPIDESDSRAKSQPSIQISTKSNESFNHPEYEEVLNLHNVQKKTTREENKTWNIIVDTGSLLNKKSRKELQLLRGLKGTNLIVPRIVVRELDCMLKRGSLFRRTTEVSEALEWIEDCMKNTKWWIHVQNSAEEVIPPTPPASSTHWFKEDKSAFQFGSIPFSPYSLEEIVTPTAEDHILDYTLSLKRTKNDGHAIIIISNDVTLKIKAMAEGVRCETAEEFRKSLVNPFSERFLYTGSSARGPTWSCEDDTVLKEKYYPSPSKKLSKSGGMKGLKLILQHNSSFKPDLSSWL